jgi:hypothetical protein
MAPTEEARSARDQRITRLEGGMHSMFAAVAIVGLAAILALFAQSYTGRRAIVDSQRRACEQVAKPRDALNAKGWRYAEHRAAVQGYPHYAAGYAKIARFLEGPKGAGANCKLRYPYPSLWPWA